MKTERFPKRRVNTNAVVFCTTCKPSISDLKTVNSNAFRLNFFALFEIFWVYTSANLICEKTVLNGVV
jgi:hypothetical protein